MIEKILGFPVKLHWSCFLLYAISMLDFWNTYHNIDMLFYSFFLITGVLISILLHEFGHIYVANLYRFKTRKVTLMFFGGAAEIDFDFKKNPVSEFFITFAGPLVNFLIFTIIFLLHSDFFSFLNDGFFDSRGINTYFIEVAILNLIIMIFNLLPIFPMDGGRILRSLLNIVTKNYEFSTLFVAIIAIILSIFLIVVCVKYSMYFTAIIMVLILLTNYATIKSLKENTTSEGNI